MPSSGYDQVTQILCTRDSFLVMLTESGNLYATKFYARGGDIQSRLITALGMVLLLPCPRINQGIGIIF